MSLHANGYRLRRVSSDSLEVADAPTAPPLANLADAKADQEAFRKEEAEEAERDMWAHAGGKRPAWLRRPEDQPSGTPWADTEAKPQ